MFFIFYSKDLLDVQPHSHSLTHALHIAIANNMPPKTKTKVDNLSIILTAPRTTYEIRIMNKWLCVKTLQMIFKHILSNCHFLRYSIFFVNRRNIFFLCGARLAFSFCENIISNRYINIPYPLYLGSVVARKGINHKWRASCIGKSTI